jgi:DNA-binding transcriptional ArsR family regulator
MEKIDYEKYSQVLKALSHPVRLNILEVLLDNEYCVNDVSKALNIPQSISSHHLTILKNNGIVHSQKQGARAYYIVKNELAKGIISYYKRENSILKDGI